MAQSKENELPLGEGKGNKKSGSTPGRLPFLSRSSHEQVVLSHLEEKRALKQRYENLATSMAEAVVETDGKLLITGWNPAAARIFGWHMDEVAGKTLAEVLSPKLTEGQNWVDKVPELLGQGNWQGGLLFQGRGGVNLALPAGVIFERDENGDMKSLTLVCQDVSSQRRLEEKCELSEKEYHALAETLPELVWLGDEFGRTYWYNQRWYDYTGTSYEEMKGPGWQKVHDPAYLPQLLERIKRALKDGKPWEDVFPLKGKDGKFRLFYTRATPIRNKEGRVLRWVGTNSDINEVRQAQQALKESEARYQGLLDALSEGYMLFEVVPDGGGGVSDLRFVALNKAFENITRVARASLPGKTYKSVFPLETPAFLEYVARASAQGQALQFIWDSKTFGKRFMASAYLPNPGNAVVLFRDIV